MTINDSEKRFDRYDTQFHLTFDVQTEQGDRFLQAEISAKTFGQRQIGVYAINKTILDMLAAQVELGRLAAERHGEKME